MITQATGFRLAMVAGQFAIATVSAACASGSAGDSGNAGGGGVGQGGGSCDLAREALKDLIASHRGCQVDEDCAYHQSFCLREGRIDCTGAFYVNRDLSADTFQEADSAYTNCLSPTQREEECGFCDMGPADGYCSDGECAPLAL